MADLNEVVVSANRPTHNFKSCVEGLRYFSDLLLGYPGASKNLYNVRGNAWELADSAFGKVFQASEMGDTNNPYLIGDIVIFTRKPLKSDESRGIPNSDLHVGIISNIEDGVPMVSHYIPHKGESNNFLYEPISKVHLNQNTPYTPSKIIRLNVNTQFHDVESPQTKLINDESYGVKLKQAIDTLNGFDFPLLNLTPDEEYTLKLATLGLLSLESDFGGSKRFLVRTIAPGMTNLVKMARVNKPTLPSVGHGSIKPQLKYTNTTYADLDSLLKNGDISKSEYYTETSDRHAKLYNMSKLPVPAALWYNTKVANAYNPSTTPSYTANLLHWLGADTRKVGQSIEDDTKLIYLELVGLHKKYPDLTSEQLIERFRGSKLNDADKQQLNAVIQNRKIKLSVLDKLILSVTAKIDQLKSDKRGRQLQIIKKLTPGANFAAAFSDFMQDSAPIDNSFLSKSEYQALKDVVQQAIKNGRTLLGYNGDDKYLAYTNSGTLVSGGASTPSGMWSSVIQNVSDPYTRLQNLLGQAKITQDEKNYYVEDEYDFNNHGTLPNPYLGIIRNPTPYSIIRSFGVTHGAAPGVGRKVKFTIPKNELKLYKYGGKLNYLNLFK